MKRDMVKAAWVVVRRPQWKVALLLLGLAAALSAPAGWVWGVLLAMAALILTALAARVIDLNPLSPLSVLRSWVSHSKSGGGRQLAGAFALLLVGASVLYALSLPPRLAHWLAEAFEGDEGLFTALLFCVMSCLFCAAVAGVLMYLSRRAEALSVDPGVSVPRMFVDPAGRRYWRSASELLGFASVALIPAALLENWAWNVLASIVVPLFWLSVRRQLLTSES